MASTVLPNGIIIPEKYSRDWYNDLYHNWQELDNLLGGGTPKDGTLTIQKNGSTVGTFSANQATNETVNITVPDVNNGTLTIQKNGTDVATFSANSSTNATANIEVPTKTSDLTNDSGFITSDNTKIPLAGSNQISGSLIPATTDAYDLGSASKPFRGLYTPNLYGSSTMALQLFCNTSSSDGSFMQIGSSWIKLSVSNEVAYLNLSTDGIMGFMGARFIPANDNSTDLGSGDKRWKTVYCATGSINTSDSRLKNSVKDIDDKLLDAWGNIEPKQYKFNDATEKKGEKARLHTGYIAQDIQAECEKHGVNASDYGLFCYDEWDEQEEVSEEIETEKDGKKVKEKRVIQPKREKGNSYALRYEEALIVECKYLRRCIARLTARIEELEKGNNIK